MAVVEQSGPLQEDAASRPSRRGAWIRAGAVLAVIVVVGAWFWASSPRLLPGNVVGPVTGLTSLTDGIDTTKWLLADDVGVAVFTVYNDGPVPVTVAAESQDFDGWVGPRQYTRFAPASERLDPLESTAWADLAPSVVIEPGGQAWVVLSTVYPAKCQQALRPDGSNSTYFNTAVQLDVSSLGRTSTVSYELPHPVYIVRPANTNCTEADFVALDALFPTP
jgi:hypothetical protein